MYKNIIDTIKRYKTIITSVSLVVFFRAFGAGLGFFSGILVTRFLGIKESGLYFYAIDFVTILATLAGLGLNNILLREVAVNQMQKSSLFIAQIFWTIMRYVLLVSMVLILIILCLNNSIAEFVSKDSLGILLLILCPILWFLPLNTYLVTLMQGFKFVLPSSLLQFVLFYLVFTLLVLFTMPNSAIEVSIIHLTSILFVTLIGLYFSKKHLIKKKSLKKRKLKGWSQFLTMHIVNNLSLVFISLINGYFLMSEEFAVLTAANRFTLLISFCLIAINFIVAPKYAELYGQNKHKELAHFAQSITQTLIIIILPIAVFVLFFTNELMGLYGKEFAPYGYILKILIVGQVINVITGSVSYLLTLSGHEKDMKNITIIITPISVILSVILARQFGLIGIAISMSTTAIVMNVTAYFMVVKRLGFHTINFKYL